MSFRVSPEFRGQPTITSSDVGQETLGLSVVCVGIKPEALLLRLRLHLSIHQIDFIRIVIS